MTPPVDRFSEASLIAFDSRRMTRQLGVSAEWSWRLTCQRSEGISEHELDP